ncbi:MAG: hypothetical protein ACOZQL_27705 [Myxococcota bacterium]
MDTVLLQGLLDAGGVVQLDPRTYFVDQTLVVNVPVTVLGRRGTRIEAAAPLDELIRVRAQSRLEDITLSGSAEPYGSARLCRDGLVLESAAFSTFKRVVVTNFLRDGARALAGNNDSMLVEQCNFGGCGVVYATEPQPHVPEYQRVTVGPATGDGNSLLCTPPRWVRPGCPLRVADLKRVVERIESDRLVLNGPVPAVVPTWALGVGCGWWEERSGDNNISVLTLCLFRANAEVGLALNGLYGHSVINGQFDYNAFYGARIGVFGSEPVLGSVWQRPYFESNPSGSMLLGAAHDLVVQAPLHDGASRYDLIGAAAAVRGIHLGSEQELLGTASSALPAKLLGDYWQGSKLDGPMRFNARAAAITNDVLSAPAAMCQLPGGTVSAIADPGDGWWQRVLYVGGVTPTAFVSGPTLVVKNGSRTVMQHETIEFAHVGAGRWVEV